MNFSALILFILSLSLFAFSQQHNSSPGDEQTRMNVLFDEIMKTLPQDAKEKVKSARETRISNEGVSDVPQGSRIDASKNLAVEKIDPVLPPQIRIQVEKAIQEMERRNENRALEFKETKRTQQTR